MTLEEIKQLVQVVLESGVAELEVARGENRVRIRRYVESPVREVIVQPNSAMAVASAGPAAVNAATETAATEAKLPAREAKPEQPAEQENLIYVKSPIVGTFYEAPSPGAAPFVNVGDRVRPGQVLCIIESMKLMNEIESDTAGVIVAKLVQNGSPVEYGEALFAIRPD